MQTLLRTRVFASLAIAAFTAIVASSVAPRAEAADDTFAVSVYHGINGRALGLSKSLPVRAYVTKDSEPPIVLDLMFGDRVEAMLPTGTYVITVESVELGVDLPTMTVGPVEIPAGVSVDLHAKLSGKKTPIIKASVK